MFIHLFVVPQDSGDYPSSNNQLDITLVVPTLRFDTTPHPIVPDEGSSIFDRPQEFEGPEARIGKFYI